MSQKQLAGVRVAVLAMDGFEQVELTGPLKTLQAEDAEVEVLSLHKGKIRGMNLLAPGKRVGVDGLVKDADPDDYDAVFIPGGHANPDFLRASSDVLRFVSAMDRAGKPIAAICHAPWVLASAGLVKGRRLTSWPNIQEDLKNAGARWSDEAVVRDRNWLSSRGPQDLRAFEKALVELLAEQAKRAPQDGEDGARRSRKNGSRRSGTALRLAKKLLVSGAALYALRRLARRQPEKQAS